MTSLPRACDPFLRFAQALRGAGMAISPDQTIGFLESVALLGPRDMTDIHRAGRALFAVPPERMAEYDALFRAVFLDQVLQAPADGDEEDEVEAYEPTGTEQKIEAIEDTTDVGAEPVSIEQLGQRQLTASDDVALARLLREAEARLPRRQSNRRRRANRGTRIDMRRTLREAARRDGDVVQLFETRRKTRQRRIVLLVDVSGSMSDRSEELLRLAHVLVHAGDQVEVFTLGTRLTRITNALHPADRTVALARVSAAIADLDGGTRLGEALDAYLSVPRYAGFARGAAVILLSDGLERGEPDLLIKAVGRLARNAWRVDLLTPLAADPDYVPATAGLLGILPVLDFLGDGSNTASVANHILAMAKLT